MSEAGLWRTRPSRPPQPTVAGRNRPTTFIRYDALTAGFSSVSGATVKTPSYGVNIRERITDTSLAEVIAACLFGVGALAALVVDRSDCRE